MKRRCRHCGAVFMVPENSPQRVLCNDCRPQTKERGGGTKSEGRAKPIQKQTKPVALFLALGVAALVGVIAIAVLWIRKPRQNDIAVAETNSPAKTDAPNPAVATTIKGAPISATSPNVGTEKGVPVPATTSMANKTFSNTSPTILPPSSDTKRKITLANAAELDSIEEQIHKLVELVKTHGQSRASESVENLLKVSALLTDWDKLMNEREQKQMMMAMAIHLNVPSANVPSGELTNESREVLRKLRIEASQDKKMQEWSSKLQSWQYGSDRKFDDGAKLIEEQEARYNDVWEPLIPLAKDRMVRLKRVSMDLTEACLAAESIAKQTTPPANVASTRELLTEAKRLFDWIASYGKGGNTLIRNWHLESHTIQSATDVNGDCRLFGVKALALLSGGGDTSARDGLSWITGHHLGATKRLTLEIATLTPDCWPMLAVFDQLVNLNLRNIRIMGEMPINVTLAPLERLNLDYLDCTSNQFAELLRTTRPKSMRMMYCRVVGASQQDFGCDRLEQLQVFGEYNPKSSTSDKDRSGIGLMWDAIVQANKLIELTIDPSNLPPESWSKVGKLSRLKKVTLSGGAITADQFRSLSECSALTDLNISGLGVSSNALGEMKQLRNLQLVGVSSEFVSRPLTLLQNLESLTILGNHSLNDQLLEDISEIRTLRHLAVSRYDLNRPIPRESADVKTEISDTGLALLKKLPALESLALVPTKVTDQGLASLQKHPRLTLCRLDSEKITQGGRLALIDSLPAIRNRGSRRMALLSMFPVPYPRELAQYLARPVESLTKVPLDQALNRFNRNGIKLYWLNAPVTTEVSISADLTVRDALDQLAAATKCDWDADYSGYFYFGSEKSMERVRRRLDNQLVLQEQFAKDDASKWLLNSLRPIQMNGISLDEVRKVLARVYEKPNLEFKIELPKSKSSAKKITFRDSGGNGQVFEQLDRLMFLAGLDWNLDDQKRIVIRDAK